MVDWVAWTYILGPYIVAFLVGFGLIPIVVHGLGSSYPDLFAGATARISWTLGMMSFGKAILYQTAGQQFKLLAANTDTVDDDRHLHLVAKHNGEKVRAVGDEGGLGRLGKRPLGFAAAKNREMLERVGAVQDPTDIVSTTRQGLRTFNPFPDEDWYLPLRRVTADLKGSAGSEVIDNSEDEALVDAGGMNRMSPLMFTAASLLALMLGAGMALISMLAVGV
jgi:hypothetical protein